MTEPTAKDNLPGIADELQRLAERCRKPPLPGRVLDSVATALREDPGALAGMDLVTAYPPDLLAPDGTPSQGKVADAVEVVRDGLVFLPIAVTWATLWIDLGRYRASKTQANFLRLWFDGAGQVAVPTVVVLVLLVILLNAWLHRHASALRRSADRHELRQSIAYELMRATHFLTVSVSDRTKELSTKELERTARLLARSADQLEKGLGGLTDRLLTVLSPGPEGQFSTALREWTASARELGALGRSMTTPQEVLHHFVTLRNQLAEDDRVLREAVLRLTTEVRDTSAVSQVSAQAHQAVAMEVMEDTRQLGAAMERFVRHSDGLQDLMDGLIRLVEHLQERNEAAITGPGGIPPALSNAPDHGSDPFGSDETGRSRRSEGPELY
ncbi:hypothetical protein ACFRAR_08145 [Kitasatospora sp. NPDC056651]|uniref:hypothetical protein n=1 Tax=Kitasatospora sp. NPDC056651 TaxID=3345892 RepID=UPI0036816C3C